LLIATRPTNEFAAMNIEIRKMQASDTEQVLKLLRHWNIAPVTPSAEVPFPERTEIVIDNTYVATDGHRIIGVCSFYRHSPVLGEAGSLAVDPAYHRRGVGDQLGLAIRRAMYARGIRTMRSESDRPETIKWLVGRGHRIVGTVPKRHAFGLPEVCDWTVLELDLGSLPELCSESGGEA
jgi:N-acetylglutamate synthase-like GNAT family acetyltransferase